MKKVVLSLGILLAGTLVQARTITCVDLKNNEEIISVTDDMGAIVTSAVTINGVVNDLHQQQVAYTYYYGEYLMIKDVNYDEEVVEVVAVRVTGTDEFTGFFNHYRTGESQTIYATKIKCVE